MSMAPKSEHDEPEKGSPADSEAASEDAGNKVKTPDESAKLSHASEEAEDSSATARALPTAYPEMHAFQEDENDTRPWMLCIVDHDDARKLSEALRSLVAEQLRIMVCSTVMQGLKHAQAVLQKGERIAVVLSEEPLAGMTGGGMWGLQKCRALVPDAIRLLGLQAESTSLLSFGLRKLKDADVHQVFDLATEPEVVAKRLILPLLEDSDDALDESLRSATVRANSDVRLLTIPKETFADLLHRDAHLSIGITRELARRLRRQQQK